MKNRYNKKKVRTFDVEDTVSVRVPRIDHTATDLHRLPCIVVERRGNIHFLYRLQCKYGVLESSYPESELEAYGGALQIGIHDWEKAPVVSLREAAKLTNPCNAYYGEGLLWKAVLLQKGWEAMLHKMSFRKILHKLSGR